jgi:anti-sigma-K factor RskA
MIEIDQLAPVLAPPPAMLGSIMADIRKEEPNALIRYIAAQRLEVQSEPSAPLPDAKPFSASVMFQTLWNSLPVWRWGGMTALAATLTLGVGLNNARNQIAEKPAMVAVLLTAEGETAAIVNVAANGKAQLVSLKGIAVPEGKAIEIWTLWDRSVGPRSVGLISKAGSLSLNLNNLPRPQPGQLFEMTLEPSTGSPTGRPTGPVLNKGTASTAL